MAQLSPIDLQKALAGADYPADRSALVETARKNSAPGDVVQRLEQLDEKRYESPAEVSRALFNEEA